MTSLFYLVMTLFTGSFVYVTASQIRMIYRAVKSEDIQKKYQKENDGYAVVRIHTA